MWKRGAEHVARMGGLEMLAGFYLENLKERERLEDLNLDMR